MWRVESLKVYAVYRVMVLGGEEGLMWGYYGWDAIGPWTKCYG